VETATATIEERELLKTLRWWDGFVVALANPGFLIASLGFSIGTLGAWGAVLIWTASMLIGALQVWIYQEPAVMFPEKSGGIALYAHEGWKKYSAFVGPVATFGYWFGWSSGGGSTGLLLLFVIAGLLLSMNTATMDGSRALYGISQDGMTVKGLGKLNRHHVPGNAMTTDAILNILLVVIFQNTLAILAASNLGYILSHVAALTAVILLRMDRPHWPRPIRLQSFWIALAGMRAAANVLFIVVGFWKFGATGYAGNTKWLGIHNELWIGVGILIIGVVLFIYRRIVQDKGEIRWRDPEVIDLRAASVPAPAPATR
jgi:amino acid transporter